MYLHKNGVRSLLLAFRNLELETSDMMKKSNPDIKHILEMRETNPTTQLGLLNTYVSEIDNHIHSEENFLRNLFNKIHSLTFLDMKKTGLSPESEALTQIMSRLKHMEEFYIQLSNTMKDANSSIANYKNNPDPTRLINIYATIQQNLKNIEGASIPLARDLRNYIISIQKEKELIKSEEEVLLDFEKNLHSWLS
jgi:hypothetical protein